MNKLTLEQAKLVSDNHKLIYWMCHKMGLDINEWYDVCAIGLCKAALAYDPSRGKFSTVAYVTMRNEINQKRRHETRACRTAIVLSLDAPCSLSDDKTKLSDVLPDKIDHFKNVEFNTMLKSGIQKMTDRERKVFLMKMNGKTQIEIAQVVRISQSYVSRVFKKAWQKVTV